MGRPPKNPSDKRYHAPMRMRGIDKILIKSRYGSIREWIEKQIKQEWRLAYPNRKEAEFIPREHTPIRICDCGKALGIEDMSHIVGTLKGMSLGVCRFCDSTISIEKELDQYYSKAKGLEVKSE